MYKVFFNDRTIFLSDDFSGSFKKNSGLFYKYKSKEELREIIDAFFRLEKIEHLFLFHDNIEILRNEFSSCFKKIKASGGMVKRNNREILMIKRNGIWDLPKGKNDAGESAEGAALREVSEECGLDKLTIKHEITKTYHIYILNHQPVLKETTWFEMFTEDINDPVPQITENITETRWFVKEKLESILGNTFLSIIDVLKTAKFLD